jgi:hypothetical protein
VASPMSLCSHEKKVTLPMTSMIDLGVSFVRNVAFKNGEHHSPTNVGHVHLTVCIKGDAQQCAVDIHAHENAAVNLATLPRREATNGREALPFFWVWKGFAKLVFVLFLEVLEDVVNVEVSCSNLTPTIVVVDGLSLDVDADNNPMQASKVDGNDNVIQPKDTALFHIRESTIGNG